jgi:hypothetical protein
MYHLLPLLSNSPGTGFVFGSDKKGLETGQIRISNFDDDNHTVDQQFSYILRTKCTILCMNFMDVFLDFDLTVKITKRDAGAQHVGRGRWKITSST